MEAVSRELVRAFRGRMSAVDPHDLGPGGLQLAENFQFHIPGQATGRRGFRARTPRVTADGDIIAMTRFDRPGDEWLVWETDEGKVKACKTSDFSTVTTLGTGYNTFQPMSFAKDRFNRLYGTNGIDRPWRWDGLTSSLEPMGIDSPESAPAIASPTGGSLSEGDYQCAYRYLDDDLAFVDYYGEVSGTSIPSSLSTATEHTADANDQLRWTGLAASSQSRVTKVELWRTIADESETFYRLTFTGVSSQTYIGHNGTITSSASAGASVRFTVPANHGLVVGARIAVTGHSVSAYNTNHEVTAVTSTTVTTNQTFTSTGTGGVWTLNGYMTDTQSDEDLLLLTPMAVETPNGIHPIARRFTPPPNTKPFICFFQDRLFFAGSVSYNQGTVTTNGTTTLTGSSTSWTSTMTGRFIYIQGETIPYTVTFVSSTELTLHRAASTSASGKSYVLAPSPIEKDQVWFSEIDEPESVPTQNVKGLQENTGDDDQVTGLIAAGSELLVTKDRHIYALSYFAQPQIDASIHLRCRRGQLNHRCHAMFEDVLYLMDQAGVYAWNGGVPQTLSRPVQDLWRDYQLNFALRKLFFLHFDPGKETLRCFLKLSLDPSPIDGRWLEYAVREKQWSTGYTVFHIGAATIYNTAGGAELLSAYGGPNDRVLTTVTSSSTPGIDWVSSQTRGTLTAATSTTLTDSGASFDDTVLDAPVAILAGTGKHQIGRITARTGTVLTVTGISTTPAAGDTYLIGAVELKLKTGLWTLAERKDEEWHKRAFRMIYQPTSNDASLDVRRYFDHATSPETSLVTQDLGKNITFSAGSADGVVDLKLARSPLANAAGLAEVVFGGRHSDRSMADRWVAIEIRGFQGSELIKIYDLGFDSAEP